MINKVDQNKSEYDKNTSIKPHFHFKLIILNMLLIGFFSFSIICLLKGLKTVTTYQFFYSEYMNLDYQVCLKENEYFNEKCLEKNKQYIASLIDYINIEYKYNFNSSNLFDYNYTYYVTAKVVANEKSDNKKILYNKEETILEEKIIKMDNSNNFLLRENLVIDYTKYNNLMTSFRKNYTLIFDSKLMIIFHIKVHGNHDNLDEDIETAQQIVLSIPLSEQTVNIEADYLDKNDSQVIKNEVSIGAINILFYSLSFIYFLIALLLLRIIIKYIKMVVNSKTLYEKRIKKILKEYNQVIVEASNKLNLNNIKVINVSSFDELLDARETIGKPILYIKESDKKSVFIILSSHEAYRYILNANDLNK